MQSEQIRTVLQPSAKSNGAPRHSAQAMPWMPSAQANPTSPRGLEPDATLAEICLFLPGGHVSVGKNRKQPASSPKKYAMMDSIPASRT